jgi:single-strand DNA-binding protein
MSGETTLTVIGNLTADPELRFTPSGAAVASFTIACTPRTFDKTRNEWRDGDALFLRGSVWREVAEHVAESLTKGMRVIATGRLKQRSYQDNEGVKRTVIELEVDEIGPSLRYATAKVSKAARSSAQRPAEASTAPGPSSGAGSGWGGASSGWGSSGAADDPWASRGPAGANGGGHSGEPPF